MTILCGRTAWLKFLVLVAGAFVLNKAAFATTTFNASEYFPLQSGDQWTYLKNSTTIVNQTVLDGTALVNNVATKVLRESGAGSTFESNYTNDANGLRLHRQFEELVDFGDGVPRDFTVYYSPPILFSTALVNVGDQISGSGTVTGTIAGLGTFSFDYSVTSELEALENISVPLGSFLSFKAKVTIDLTGSALGQPVDETEIDTFWLAKHVGVVRQTQQLIGEGVDTFELTAISVDTDQDGINVTDDNCAAVANPLQTDSDSDGQGDACDTDDDNDGLSDDQELNLGTDPLKADTDNDGTDDGDEVAAGGNPLVNEVMILQLLNSINFSNE